MFGHLSYLMIGISPIGGLLVSIPFGLHELKYPAWLVILTSPPMSYVQVVVVDAAWDALNRWPWFKHNLEKKRSARVESLLASGGAFWATFIATPILGPWVVMAFMRYANVPQRRVALPILLSVLIAAAVQVYLWIYVPELFAKQVA